MFWPHVARLLLRLGGWTVIGGPPDVQKAVIIGAPHTSNWDGFWAFVYMVAVGLKVRFFIKESLFWFPLNLLLHGLGGIPLDRSKARRAVDQAVQVIDENESILFGLAPEGTRSLTPGWKSGFYRIAENAGVPVVLAFFCYTSRRIGIGPVMTLTGDVEADMQIIRSFYEAIEGRHPDKTSPVEITTQKAISR